MKIATRWLKGDLRANLIILINVIAIVLCKDTFINSLFWKSISWECKEKWEYLGEWRKGKISYKQNRVAHIREKPFQFDIGGSLAHPTEIMFWKFWTFWAIFGTLSKSFQDYLRNSDICYKFVICILAKFRGNSSMNICVIWFQNKCRSRKD